MDSFTNPSHTRCISHREVAARFQRDLRNDLDLSAEMHQESAVADVYDLDAVDVREGGDYLLVMVLACGIDSDITEQEIFTDINDIDALDVAAGFSDRGCYLAEFSRRVLDLYA